MASCEAAIEALTGGTCRQGIELRNNRDRSSASNSGSFIHFSSVLGASGQATIRQRAPQVGVGRAALPRSDYFGFMSIVTGLFRVIGFPDLSQMAVIVTWVVDVKV